MTTDDIMAIPANVLSEQQRRFYFENGYLALHNMIPEDWLARLLTATNDIIDRSRTVTESDAIYDLEPGHTAEAPRLRRLSSPVDHHPEYWAFASESPVVDIVADLVGPNVKFHHSKLNFKWARGGEEVKWHQDITFWPHTNYSPLTVGIYLDDVTDDQGPLGVIPGSHKGVLYNQYNRDGQWVGALDPDDVAALDLDMAEYITGAAGTITIHNCRTIHGSPKNFADTGRGLFLNVYSSADAFPYTYNPISSVYSGTVIRGTPALWAHHDPRPCMIPPDWSGGYTSIYAVQQEEDAATKSP